MLDAVDTVRFDFKARMCWGKSKEFWSFLWCWVQKLFARKLTKQVSVLSRSLRSMLTTACGQCLHFLFSFWLFSWFSLLLVFIVVDRGWLTFQLFISNLFIKTKRLFRFHLERHEMKLCNLSLLPNYFTFYIAEMWTNNKLIRLNEIFIIN